MLLGNKIDMADLPPRPKRQVTFWQGQQLAQVKKILGIYVTITDGFKLNIRSTCAPSFFIG